MLIENLETIMAYNKYVTLPIKFIFLTSTITIKWNFLKLNVS